MSPSPPDPAPAVEVRGLVKRYGDVVAIDGLDLVVPRGSTYALLGPNGSGKTTTIRAILGIQTPDRGTVRVLGVPPREGVLDRVGYLPEERGLYKKMTAVETLVFLARLKGVEEPVARDRAAAWLDRVGLADRARTEVRALSKGMQQKLQFVSALVHEPELVILDEPFSGLDPINQQALREVLADLRREGRTILFSTHIIEHAERLCEHAAILSRGRVVVAGEQARIKREHGGVHVTLALDPWTPDAVAAVRAAPGVAGADVDGREIELVLTDGAEPRALLAHLVEAGVGLRGFRVVEPSLRRIFVERVGSRPIEEGALV